jgi:hypothetical protein
MMSRRKGEYDIEPTTVTDEVKEKLKRLMSEWHDWAARMKTHEREELRNNATTIKICAYEIETMFGLKELNKDGVKNDS